MIHSIKQIFKTPIKLLIFFVCILVSSVLLILGITLLISTSLQLNKLEHSFTTIGTAEQKESSTQIYSDWSATEKTYTNYVFPTYDTLLPLKMLDFKGSSYLTPPQKRPYYGAYMPKYSSAWQSARGNARMIMEFSPVEDCVPDKPVLVNIEKVLLGDAHGSSQMWYCDEWTENPSPLKAGETYIAGLLYENNGFKDASLDAPVVFYSDKNLPHTTQCDKAGRPLDTDINSMQGKSCEVVTDDFYENGRGKYWLNHIKSLDMIKATIPVLPTDSLTILPAFHSKEAVITKGREFSKKELKKGKEVCLIPQEFAQLNNLKPEDSITLPLYFADYNNPSSLLFGMDSSYSFSLLNTKGEIFPVFWKAKYKIVGIYQYKNGTHAIPAGSTEIALDQVIIPTGSVKASDENNIVSAGPMRSTTTSFQIPNGTVDKYKEAFSKVPKSDFIKISFDDNGYTKIKKELDQSRATAYMLCCIGILSAIAVGLLLLYFFVIKQKKRIAIERSLGATKRQCRVSLLSSLMLFVLLASIVGSIISCFFANPQTLNSKKQTTNSYYSTAYSSQKENLERSAKEPAVTVDSALSRTLPIAVTPIVLTLFMLLISLLVLNKQLNREMIEHLGDRENE